MDLTTRSTSPPELRARRVGGLTLVESDAGDSQMQDPASLGLLQRCMALAASKWSLPIMDRLADRPARYNHLLAALDTVAPKVLTQTLRRLEKEGFVSARQVGSTGRMYSLTDRGVQLRRQIVPLRTWAAQQVVTAPVCQAQCCR